MKICGNWLIDTHSNDFNIVFNSHLRLSFGYAFDKNRVFIRSFTLNPVLWTWYGISIPLAIEYTRTIESSKVQSIIMANWMCLNKSSWWVDRRWDQEENKSNLTNSNRIFELKLCNAKRKCFSYYQIVVDTRQLRHKSNIWSNHSF